MIVYDYNLFTSENMFSLSLRGEPKYVDDYLAVKYLCNIYDTKKRYDNLHYTPPIFSLDQENLFPLAVRYISPARDLYIIERPPFLLHEIDFSTSKSYKSRKVPKVLNNRPMWIPWTVALIKLNTNSYTFNLYFNDSPINSFDDILVPAYLPNIGGNGQVCMGSDTSIPMAILEETSSVTEMYKSLFNMYFSGWNSDIFNSTFNPRYFYDKKIIQRVQSLKSSPKDMTEILLYSNVSTSRYFKNFLYFLSNLTLQEHLEYLTYVKDSYANSSHYASIYTIGKIIPRNLSDGVSFDPLSGKLTNTIELVSSSQSLTYTEQLFSNHFAKDQHSCNYTVYIKDLPFKNPSFWSAERWTNEECYKAVTHPKLIAQIYKQVQQEYKDQGIITSQMLNVSCNDLFNEQQVSLNI